MKRIEIEMPEMWGSHDFFGHLRGAMRSLGLGGEEKFGLGVHFVAASSVLPNPLRLSIEEKTEGNANYFVRRVAKLMPSGSYIEISSEDDDAWNRFKADPQHKVVYLPDGDRSKSDGRAVRFEIKAEGLSRVIPSRKDGRVVEKREHVEAAIACISADHGFEIEYAPRWLTMSLDKPTPSSNEKKISKRELAQWQQVHETIQERAEQGIALPDWTELVVEQTSADYGAARHLPAFLQVWKTMSLLRSLQSGQKKQESGLLTATFEDFAATGLLVRKLFKEGHWFPSAKKLFARIRPAGARTALLHPLTEKDISYEHKREQRAQWLPVIEY